MEITVDQIARIVDGLVEGDGSIRITKPGRIESANEGALSFLGNPKYESYLYDTKASAVLVNRDFKAKKTVSTNLIRVADVYSALGRLLEIFDNALPTPSGVAEEAVIHEEAEVHSSAKIGTFVQIQAGAKVEENAILDGHVFVGSNSVIGSGTRLYPGVKIMHRCYLGSNCIVHSNAVIGGDGFGFSRNDGGGFDKVSQTGGVRIEDSVEIGANCAIDRGSIGDTIIKSGAKLDNLIQIAHNVEIGQNTVIAAQAGVAGSTKIGANCMIGGQVGIVGHLTIHDGTQIQAQSGVASSTRKSGEKLYGTPAIAYSNYLRSYAVFRNSRHYLERIQKLERELENLKSSKKP